MSLSRAYSLLTVKSADDDLRVIEGIATTPSTDREGDIVEPKGADFKLPIPLLMGHDSRQPIGHVTHAKVTKDGIEIKAKLVKITEPGALKEELDRAWQQIKSGLVGGLSIGFKPVESSRIGDTWNYRFVKWLWLELSAVVIPANQDCSITQVRSIDHRQRASLGQSLAPVVRSLPPGVSGSRTPKTSAQEANPMKRTIAEQIAAFEATRVAKAAELDKIMDASAETGETLNAEQKEAYDTLTAEVKEVDEHLDRLRLREKSLKATARPAAGETENEGTRARVPAAAVKTVAKTQKGFGFVRLLAARFMAKEDGGHPADIAAARGWGDDIVNVLRTPKDILQKAAVAPANTWDSTWAAPLVTYQNLQEEFIELLRPKSVIARIPGLRSVPFNIKVPRETSGTTAYWVGQGSPKPVSKGALDTVTLDFSKVAGITVMTQELMRFAKPNAEQLMVNSLVKAITYLTDRDFLDPSKAASVGVSPASITNGVTPITATGSNADAFRADFSAMLALYTMANYSLDGLVVVMTQTQALRLGLMRNDFGTKEFPELNKDGGSIEGIPVVTSENIVANGGSPADGAIIVAINAADILLADDGAVEVDVSTEASLQVDDAPDSPYTSNTVSVSLWQNNLVGIRCERFINWTKARSGSVQYITGGNYR